jgi:metal-responsive CopG/Arc/MetJ family transcriptional regulator
MKTAVSIPDDLFEQAEELARRSKKSRSQLFADALRE